MTTHLIYSLISWNSGINPPPRTQIQRHGKTKCTQYECTMTHRDYTSLYLTNQTMKKCKICSKEFQPFSSLDRTCSSKCKNKHIAKREKEKRQKVRLKKKESISELTKVADVLWSKDTRKIGYCEYCGKTENLNAHHII